MKDENQVREELKSSYATMTKVDRGFAALITDLTAQPTNDKTNTLFSNALKGNYSDWENTHPTPKMLLAKDLKEAGCSSLVSNIIDGKYDDDKGPGYTTYNTSSS